MLRGQLGIEDRPMVLFVFEELLAHLSRPREERLALRLRQWNAALACWDFDFQVCDYIESLINRHGVPVEVVTWRSPEFAKALHDRLWELRVPVRDTISSDYHLLSHRIATDPEVTTVYDADPHHRYGYGFKTREIDYGRI